MNYLLFFYELQYKNNGQRAALEVFEDNGCDLGVFHLANHKYNCECQHASMHVDQSRIYDSSKESSQALVWEAEAGAWAEHGARPRKASQ